MSGQSVKTLGRFISATKFDKGLGARLPEAYRKFYNEWKLTVPTAVHYIPEEGKWRRNEETGEVRPVQNIPIPIRFPEEAHMQIWGGEGIIQGFQKREPNRRRVPHFWVPDLRRSVVYSEILDKYIAVVVTDRALQCIHSSFGFDHYILKTPACDLQTLLPLKLKRLMLQELSSGCPKYEENPELQKQVLDKYKQYLEPYTPEEIEWYGYSFNEAIEKLKFIIEAENKPVPLKKLFRIQLIEQLKTTQNEAASKEGEEIAISEPTSSSWIQRINPFGKKHET